MPATSALPRGDGHLVASIRGEAHLAAAVTWSSISTNSSAMKVEGSIVRHGAMSALTCAAVTWRQAWPVGTAATGFAAEVPLPSAAVPPAWFRCDLAPLAQPLRGPG